MPIKAKDCCSLNVELTKFTEFHESVFFFSPNTYVSRLLIERKCLSNQCKLHSFSSYLSSLLFYIFLPIYHSPEGALLPCAFFISFPERRNIEKSND